MKKCGSCKQEKSFDEFGKSKSRKDGLQSYCKACRKLYTDQWYKENQALQVSRVGANQARIQQYVYDYLKEHPCVDCGESRVPCLQFDHIDPTLKSFNVSTGFKVAGLQKVIDEIAKCVVRCANCHAVKTAEQFGWYGKITL